MRAFTLTFAILASVLGTNALSDHEVRSVRGYGHEHLDMRDMVRHSVVTRDNGDPVTFWVHNSFREKKAVERRKIKAVKPEKLPSKSCKAKRPKQHVDVVDHTGIHTYGGEKVNKLNKCGESTFKNLTNADAPYTGGCQEIRDWAAKRRGRWRLEAKFQGDITLIVAGSNSGANCRFVVRNNPDKSKTYVGTHDVRDLIRDSRRRFATFYNGQERMTAEGRMKCEYQKKNQTTTRQLDWAILKYDGKV